MNRKETISQGDLSGRARKMLWPLLGGEENLATLLVAIESSGGRLFVHGSAARVLLDGGGDFNDIDLVVTGIEGEGLAELARRAMGEGWDVGVREHFNRKGFVKTIEMAIRGRQVADLVCARRDDQPDLAATIEDHLAGCFTPDGKLVAFRIMADQGEKMEVRPIEVQKEIDLDPTRVRPDHIWLWFHALVGGKVPSGRELAVQQMIQSFMSTRGEELVMWRREESSQEWMAKRHQIQGVPPSRVREVTVRSFGRCNVEGVVEKLSSALRADPARFWRMGMATGLLPAVFPVLKVIDQIPTVEETININLGYVWDRSNEQNWFLIFGPILAEFFQPIRDNPGCPQLGYKGYSWQNQANPFIGIETIAGVGGEPRQEGAELEGRIRETNWRWEVMRSFALYHQNSLLKRLRGGRKSFASYTEFPARSLARVSRHVAAKAVANPLEIYALLTSYLPLGGNKIKEEIRRAALSGGA